MFVFLGQEGENLTLSTRARLSACTHARTHASRPSLAHPPSCARISMSLRRTTSWRSDVCEAGSPQADAGARSKEETKVIGNGARKRGGSHGGGTEASFLQVVGQRQHVPGTCKAARSTKVRATSI